MVEIAPTPDSVRVITDGRKHRKYSLPLYINAEDTSSKFSSYELTGKISKFSSLPASYRFASSIAWCGGLMKNSSFINPSSWSDAVSLANNSYNSKDVLQKEFIALLQKAKKIYSKEKKESGN